MEERGSLAKQEKGGALIRLNVDLLGRLVNAVRGQTMAFYAYER